MDNHIKDIVKLSSFDKYWIVIWERRVLVHREVKLFDRYAKELESINKGFLVLKEFLKFPKKFRIHKMLYYLIGTWKTKE